MILRGCYLILDFTFFGPMQNFFGNFYFFTFFEIRTIVLVEVRMINKYVGMLRGLWYLFLNLTFFGNFLFFTFFQIYHYTFGQCNNDTSDKNTTRVLRLLLIFLTRCKTFLEIFFFFTFFQFYHYTFGQCNNDKLLRHYCFFVTRLCSKLILIYINVQLTSSTMCKICDCNGNYESLQGLKMLNCSHCPLLTSIPHIEGLKWLNCNECSSLSVIPHIEGLKYLWCAGCRLLTSIPPIEELEILYCIRCSSLTEILHIKELKELDCSYCTLLTLIPHIEGLKKIQCWNCPRLYRAPWVNGGEYSKHLKRVRGKRLMIHKYAYKIYKNVSKWWNYRKLLYKLQQIQIELYANPRMPYMQYFIDHELYNENKGPCRIGIITKEDKLIFLLPPAKK